MDKILKLKEMVNQSENIVFFGGAGVSTESGIPDFRSENGIYNAVTKYGYSPETILSHSFYVRNKGVFFDYFKNNLLFLDAKPNKAHIILAKLEEMGKLKAVITQNIDNLHQMAGSKNVIELHGTLFKNYCTKCKKTFDIQYVIKDNGITVCDKCGGIVRPNVVLYEEGLDELVIDKAIRYISNADMLIIGGTSLAVYPAAGFINYYKGDKLVLINKSKTSMDARADLVIHDSIGEVLGALI